jgi:hypothetical protein
VALVAQHGIDECDHQPQAVEEVVGKYQTDRCRAVLKKNEAEVPAGARFGINRQLRAFVSPVAELSAWPGEVLELDVRRPSI